VVGGENNHGILPEVLLVQLIPELPEPVVGLITEIDGPEGSAEPLLAT